MSSRKNQKADRRAEIAIREAAARAQRRRRLWIGAASAATVIAIGVVVAAVITAQTPSAAVAATTAPPPWPAPSDPEARAKAAGLTVARMEGSALHIHQHLSITVDGQQVPVPANLGVDPRQGSMSALHTHDTSGIIHVESPKVASFTLGQLFTEWGVKLGSHQIAGYRDGAGDRRVSLFVNGAAVTTALPKLRLRDQQDIAIVVTSGTTRPAAPAPFDWTSTS